MQHLMEVLSIAVSSVALFLVVFVVCFNLYLIKRNGFYVSANCWFCNTWTKVLYADRNSFDCPTCSQYNGFKKDGGYNKVIQAQHITSFTKYKTTNKTESVANGLCMYCNNNQQLKIYQLANFTPLREDHYDVEIEHFRTQLEKAYKLCKKCEVVLKSTIDHQNTWIFGNRLKGLCQKGATFFNLPKSAKDANQSYSLRILKYTLIFLTISVLFNTLNVKIDFPSDIKSVPKNLEPYGIVVNSFFDKLRNATGDLQLTIHNKWVLVLPKRMVHQTGSLSMIAMIGLILEILLMAFEEKSVSWKINESLAWTILAITTNIVINQDYIFYIGLLQVFSSAVLLYSYTANVPKENPKKTRSTKRYEFKKLGKPTEASESSEEEEENIQASRQSVSRDLNPFHCHSYSASSPEPNLFQNQLKRQTANLNDSFATAVRQTANLNDSFATAVSAASTSVLNNTSSSRSNSDLHQSLDNLHLNSFQHRTCTSPGCSMTSRRSILSPPKLKNVTQNSWTAGGFWKNDIHVIPVSTEYPNLSRTSSQTSGFVSNPGLNPSRSLPPSREASVCGDFERASILSEPAYHFSPIKAAPPDKSGQLYYKANNNIFYPVLNQNNVLFIKNGMPHCSFEGGFGSLPFTSFNPGITVPMTVVGEKPVSSLFKNLGGPASHME